MKLDLALANLKRVEYIPRCSLVGQTYGFLFTVALIGRLNNCLVWLCRCLKCGSFGAFRQGNLKAGTACGCLVGIRDGRHKHPLYKTWQFMHYRCSRPNRKCYEYYGARGIKVCERWNDFWSFVQDMGEKPSPSHTLDRIDNDGHYEPSNCRWATTQQQARNYSRNVLFEINGITQTRTDWVKQVGIPESTVRSRIKRGLTPAQALELC